MIGTLPFSSSDEGHVPSTSSQQSVTCQVRKKTPHLVSVPKAELSQGWHLRAPQNYQLHDQAISKVGWIRLFLPLSKTIKASYRVSVSAILNTQYKRVSCIYRFK